MTNKWTYKKSWCARRRRVLVWRFIAPDLIAAVLWCSADRRGTQMVCSPAATANSWVSCQHGDIWNLWSGRESGGWFSGHGESRNSEKKHEQRKTCLIICLFINCQYLTVRLSVLEVVVKTFKNAKFPQNHAFGTQQWTITAHSDLKHQKLLHFQIELHPGNLTNYLRNVLRCCIQQVTLMSGPN